MFAKLFFISAIIAVTIGVAIEDVAPSAKISKEEFIKKYPDLVQWFGRAIVRMKTQRRPTSVELSEARLVLAGVTEQIYDFVTSPAYFETTDIFIAKVVDKVSPILGVFPVAELKQLYSLLEKNPDLYKDIFEKDTVKQFVPGAAELDTWVANATSHILKDKEVAVKADERKNLFVK